MKKSISQLQYNWLTTRAIFSISTEENVIHLFNIYLDLLLSNLWSSPVKTLTYMGPGPHLISNIVLRTNVGGSSLKFINRILLLPTVSRSAINSTEFSTWENITPVKAGMNRHSTISAWQIRIPSWHLLHHTGNI